MNGEQVSFGSALHVGDGVNSLCLICSSLAAVSSSFVQLTRGYHKPPNRYCAKGVLCDFCHFHGGKRGKKARQVGLLCFRPSDSRPSCKSVRGTRASSSPSTFEAHFVFHIGRAGPLGRVSYRRGDLSQQRIAFQRHFAQNSLKAWTSGRCCGRTDRRRSLFASYCELDVGLRGQFQAARWHVQTLFEIQGSFWTRLPARLTTS